MKKANELWRYVSQKGLKPLPKTSVSTWADDYRILSSGAAEPGKWKTSRAPYQKDIMDAFTQSGINRVVVMSSAQIGKALEVNTPIITPKGWKRMQDLKPGDEVFDENGRACRVVACTPAMQERPCYKITFSDFSSIVADENHEWVVQIDKSSGFENIKITTREMAASYKKGNRNRYAIPVTLPLQMPNKDNLPLDPYTLGVWLGDGNSMSAQITMPENDLSIARRIEAGGHEVIIRDSVGKSPNVKTVIVDPYHRDNVICCRGHDKRITGYTKGGHCAECARQFALRSKWKGIKDIPVDPVKNIQHTMHSTLKAMGVLGNKHIPHIFLTASEEQRWSLLQGLMDTDGYVSQKGVCELTLKSKMLIENVSDLLHSLGIKHTLKPKKAICTNSPTRKESVVWRIVFTTWDNAPVFSLKRKQARLMRERPRRLTETLRRRVIAVKYIGEKATKCIEVDSKSHLYLAGRAMIPTHNSDIMNNVIGRFAHLDPCAIMMIAPTIDMAQDFSKTRISPMLRDTKVLSKLFYNVKEDSVKAGAKTRDGNNTILSKLFPGGRLIMCGANSPAGLASRPVRILLADEVDRFPDSAGTEGDPVDLAAKRMTTFWNRVMGLFSTPTNEGASRIEAEYMAGTQEEWQYECPNCKEYHTLRYLDMDTDYTEHKDKKGRKTVTIESVKWCCPDCGYKFEERDIKAAPQKYTALNPIALENGIRSFFVNAFSSPWITWKEVMREWLEAKGDPTREQVVVNTRFGEPYRQRGAFEDEAIFLRRREQYKADLPEGVLMLTASVDTQDNRLEYEVCGWGEGEECWGIIKGVILGVPDKAKTWQELDSILDRVYYFANGTGLRISRTFIDSGGHYTSHVYQYCEASYGKQRVAIKGKGGVGIPLVYKIGRAQNTGIPLVILGVDDGKQQVMNRLAITDTGAGYFHFPLDGDESLKVRGYDQLYFKGIISEHKKQVKKNGTLHTIWETTAGVRNEPLDLRVYNLACMQSCVPDWERLRQALESDGGASHEPPAKKSKRQGRNVMRQANIW